MYRCICTWVLFASTPSRAMSGRCAVFPQTSFKVLGPGQHKERSGWKEAKCILSSILLFFASDQSCGEGILGLK